MAETPYPIPVSTRQSAVLLGDGAATYGPFDFGIFDVADVLVETRAASPGTDPFVEVAVTVTKTDPTAAYSAFTITFAAAITSATQFRVTGDRVPRRALAISKGQALDVVQLERELSAFTVNLQELRRRLDGLPGIVAGDAASQAVAAAADAEVALATIQGLGVDPSGYLSKAGNLSGLGNVATARTNLGLGSAALQAASAFAAAAHSHAPLGVAGGIKGFARALKTTNDGTTPNSKMLVTAAELVVKKADGEGLLLTDVNVAITMGAAGLNSIDSGAEAASTWYYLWVVSDGTNVAGLFSLSNADCATLGGYVFKALVGAVYNDAASNFRRTLSNGKLVEQAEVSVYNSAPSTAWTAQGLTTAVPPVATRVRGRVTNTNNASNVLQLSPEASAAAPGLCAVNVNPLGVNGGIGSDYAGGPFDLAIITAQTIYRRAASNTSTVNILVQGFDLPMGA